MYIDVLIENLAARKSRLLDATLMIRWRSYNFVSCSGHEDIFTRKALDLSQFTTKKARSILFKLKGGFVATAPLVFLYDSVVSRVSKEEPYLQDAICQPAGLLIGPNK